MSEKKEERLTGVYRKGKNANDTYDGVSESVVGPRDGKHGAEAGDDAMERKVEQLILVVLGFRDL